LITKNCKEVLGVPSPIASSDFDACMGHCITDFP
jgi:hypothetical protein